MKVNLVSFLQQVSGPACLLLALCCWSGASFGATITWDGGGADDNFSTGVNWVGDASPATTGDSLVFAGSTRVTPYNDSYVTTLGSNSFNFAAGAASFNVGSAAQITVGNSAANDNFVTKVSTNDQTISANLKLAGGQRDRTIIMTGGGTLNLTGNIDFANDWLFPNTTAGTIVLSGSNSGDGKGAVLTAGTNTARAMMRNNVAGTTLVLGSDTALGNSGLGDVGLGTANLRGLVTNQNLTILTANGNRNLSGSTMIINAPKLTFSGTTDLAIGNLINQGGNRDFWVTSTGNVTVQNSLSLSHDQTGRNLYLSITGSGNMTVNGKVYDTFHSGGITTGTGTLRKAGTGLLTLNGNSTYAAITTVEAGTLLVNGVHTQGTGSNAGRYLVSGGAKLGGSGTIKLSDTNAGTTGLSISGILAPGASAGSIGTLTVDGLNSVRSMMAIEGSGSLLWDLNTGLTADVLALTNASANDLFFNNNVINFNDLSAGSLGLGTYTLITSDASSSFSGLTLTGSVITAGLSIGTGLESYPAATLELSGNNIVLKLSAIPEPATLLLASVCLVGLGVQRRR
jgi:autotransporter-associated beta strand protein